MSIKGSYTLTISLFTISILSGTVLSSSAFATDTTTSQDNVAVNVPVSCTMNGTGMTSHTANIPNGTYESEIGTTTLKSFCNDSQGFAIYAIGYTNEEYGNTNLIGASGGQTIVTGTATTTGNPDVSNWAVKLATDSTATYPLTLDNGFNAYSSVPSSYTKVAHRDSGTDLGSSATGASLTTTYAAYISKTQQADTYNGKVKYTLVHPADHAAPIICNSNATTISEAVCLQDFAHVSETNRNSIIASMTPEQQYTLKDSRDGKTYTIAKYQVGNSGNYDVWMTKNLDLDLDSNTTYTNLDTDIGYNTATGQYDPSAWQPMRSTYAPTTTHTTEWWRKGLWEPNFSPESYDPGELYWNGIEGDFVSWSDYESTCDMPGGTAEPICDSNSNPINNYTSSTGIMQYHLGNYYNQAASLASNDSSIFDEAGISTIEQSICPAGWTLPRNYNTDRNGDSFYALWDQYGFASSSTSGTNALWTNPLYFVPSGSYTGYLLYVGYDGSYLAPHQPASYYSSYAYYNIDGYSSLFDNNDLALGHSIRCIARPVVSP